jgi:hypothetical protein
MGRSMKLLLDDRFAPMTSRVAFFEAPLRVLGDAFFQRERSAISPLLSRVRRETLREPFPDVLLRLPPLTHIPLRTLLLATDSAWTAYFDNGPRGPDPTSALLNLCPRLGCRGLAVMCIPDTLTGQPKGARGRWGGVQLELFGPEERDFLNCVRAISVTHDGYRWEFGASGEVQPFEKPEYYTARRIRDRFTAEMLEEYGAALGVRYFDPEFYLAEGLLLEVRHHLPFLVRGKRLAQVQQELGIRP